MARGRAVRAPGICSHGSSRGLQRILCGLPLLADLAFGLRLGELTASPDNETANATATVRLPGFPKQPFDDGWAQKWYRRWWNCRPQEVPLPQEEDPDGKLQFVHVVYSADEKELPGVLLSMTSLSRHLRKPEECIVHLIVAKEVKPKAQKMLECFQRTISETGTLPKVTVHTMFQPNIRFAEMKSDQPFRKDLIMPNTFVRFYLHMYMPHARRAVWLDADTIVRADVAELYRMRLRNTSVAAMLPEAGQVQMGKLLEAEVKGEYPFKNEEYNTGVILFDLDKWRLDNYTEEAEYWTHHFFALGGDQVGLNMAVINKVDKIPDWRWNTRGFQFGRLPWRCVNGSKIMHWSGSREKVQKPWLIGKDGPSRARFRYDVVEPYVLDPPCNIGDSP